MAPNINPSTDARAKNHVVAEVRECRKSPIAHFPSTPEITKSITTFPEAGSCIHRSANALLIGQNAAPSPVPGQTSLGQSGAVRRATFRRLRAAFRLGRIFCGPRGPYALWKPPRYFSASRSASLVTARRNQIGKCVRIVSIVEAPRKLVRVERQIIFADLVVTAHDAAFQETPESLDCVCVNCADYVLLGAGG